MPLITDSYKDQLEKMHEQEKGSWGVTATNKFLPRICAGIDHLKPKTVLDYGSGAGRLKIALDNKYTNLEVREYDPGVPEVAGPGWPSEFVVCVDVLEHVEPECIDEVLIDLARCSLRHAYVTVAMYEARRKLPDGRNAHILLKDLDWWKKKLSNHFRIINSKEEGKTGIFFLKNENSK